MYLHYLIVMTNSLMVNQSMINQEAKVDHNSNGRGGSMLGNVRGQVFKVTSILTSNHSIIAILDNIFPFIVFWLDKKLVNHMTTVQCYLWRTLTENANQTGSGKPSSQWRRWGCHISGCMKEKRTLWEIKKYFTSLIYFSCETCCRGPDQWGPKGGPKWGLRERSGPWNDRKLLKAPIRKHHDIRHYSAQ